MEKIFEQIEKLLTFFKKDSVFFAAIISFSIYLFNYFRRREDANVKARIEADEKAREAHSKSMEAKLEIFHSEMAGHRMEMAFHNAQMREVMDALSKTETPYSRTSRYYRRR